MKTIMMAGIIFVALGTANEASAAQFQPDDVNIISVIPRSPDVKPYFMSVPADGHREKAESNLKAAAFAVKTPKQLASADNGKPVSGTSGAKD